MILLLFSMLLATSCGSGCGSGGGGNQGGENIPGPAAVVRGPQVALVSESSSVIAWLTNKSSVGSVEFGLDSGLGSQAADAAATTDHVLSLEGLQADTLYLYRILLDGTVASEGHSFRTAPADPASPVRFDVVADLGSGAPQASVAAQILASNPSLVILPGDIVYDTGGAKSIDPRYFVPYAHLIDHIPFYVALGNHDVLTAGGQPLLDALHLPVNDEDGTERFYSFNWSNVHFVALNSNTALGPGSSQASWLERDLSQNSQTWTVVFFHHPPFSSSRHGSSINVRQNLEPLFDSHHVDLVFTGHDHDYERTYPLKAAQVVSQAQDPDYMDPEGTIYIVSGGGGRDLYPNGRSSFTAFSESTHEFVQVDVSGLDLAVSAIREDGAQFDHMTIKKTAPP